MFTKKEGMNKKKPPFKIKICLKWFLYRKLTITYIKHKYENLAKFRSYNSYSRSKIFTVLIMSD